MAITPPNDQALLREVNDAVRQDMMVSVWQRYGRWMLVGLVAALAVFAGWLWWDKHSQTKAGEAAEKLDVALKATAGSGTPDAAALAALEKDTQPGYRAAARLMKAAGAAQKGSDVEAAGLYGQIAADTGLAQPYRDLALVRQTALQFDKMKPEDVVARLKPLAQAGNPWFGSAGEMTAIAYMKMRKNDLAGPVFAALAKDPKVPSSIRSRAVQMAGLLGVDAVDTGKNSPAGGL